MREGNLLRFAAPHIYNRMVEAFSTYNIYPYDVHATLETNENGFDVILRFSNDFSQVVSQHFRPEQAIYPDGEITRFFEFAAQQGKSMVNAYYYKYEGGWIHL